MEVVRIHSIINLKRSELGLNVTDEKYNGRNRLLTLLVRAGVVQGFSGEHRCKGSNELISHEVRVVSELIVDEKRANGWGSSLLVFYIGMK